MNEPHEKINKVEIRNLQMDDYNSLFKSFYRIYADGSDVFWTRDQISRLIQIFPEGQIVIVVN
ncbi:MAG: carbon-nitrogen hydrolase, partial [Bacteroides sp.]